MQVAVRVRGGLGNQLFTYACGYSVSQDLSLPLVLDLSDYSSKYARPYMLDHFCLDKCMVLPTRWPGRFGRLWSKLRMNMLYDLVLEGDSKESLDLTLHAERKRRTYLHGYWQSESYFEKYKEDILRQFRPKEIPPLVHAFRERHSKRNMVSIHIRRGDYISLHRVLHLSYYYRALEFLERHLADPYFVFFSDDIGWVRAVFGERENYIYPNASTQCTDWEEFLCMSSCQHYVVANSTFSWWAAYLGQGVGSTVIAPELHNPIGLYYPNNWRLESTHLAT